MSTTKKRFLLRAKAGELPLIKSIANRLGLREILHSFIPQKKNEEVAPADVLMLLIANLSIGKQPLYELESWVQSLDLNVIDYAKYKNVKFTDDRFGNCIDRLFSSDRSSLMTTIVLKAINVFNIDLKQVNNDSTSVKAFGEYPRGTSTGFELKRGKSKDHRPDLKQLLFTLTIAADGAVPIHYKTYPGNRTDDTTHIETWDALCKINNGPDFLYVADCKVCTDKQLSYIAGEKKGRVVTIIPDTWSEVTAFKKSLREKNKTKKEILRITDEYEKNINYLSAYDEECLTNKQGYKIHWIHSSNKNETDFACREGRITRAESKLKLLLSKINKRNLKSKEEISQKCTKILTHYKVESFISIFIEDTIEEHKIQNKSGRPGKDTTYKTVINIIHTLSWSRNKNILDKERNIDGIFPLLSTDLKLSAKEVLSAYKYQPRLEKRFSQFKSVHNAAPLLFKKIERVEANMFIFFMALMIQALLEREIRYQMKLHNLTRLQLYPEERDCAHPTTAKIFDAFSSISSYQITEKGEVVEQHRDDFTAIQRSILDLLKMNEAQYWGESQRT